MILQLLMAFIGFLLSPIGLFTLLSGLLLFILLPVASMVTGMKQFAHVHLYLALWSTKRAAIVVSEHNDLLFKSMEFDDIGVEKITFGTDTKEFEDPATALHHFFGFPFALADEVHGVLFDPRHAGIGDRKEHAEAKNEMHIRATDGEWDAYEVYGWVRGVFELPKEKYELVDLSKVRHIVTGSERAEYPSRIETMYKNSRMPYTSGTAITRFMMPVFAFLATFGGLWLISSQGGSTGGTGGTTVGYGAILFGIAAGVQIDWKKAGKMIAVVLPLPTIFMLLFVFVSPITAIVSVIVFGMGFLLLPFLTLLLRPTKTPAGALAKFYLMLGFLGYRKPVLEWTPAKYRLREFDDLEDVDEGKIKWYSLANTLIGFTFAPEPESWGPEVMEHSELEMKKEAATDGGGATNIPAGYSKFPDMQRAVYGGFVPSKISRTKYYLHSGITLSRFANAAIGEKSLRKLLQAKEKYGEDGWGLSDKSVLYFTGGAGLLGTALGVFLFFL